MKRNEEKRRAAKRRTDNNRGEVRRIGEGEKVDKRREREGRGIEEDTYAGRGVERKTFSNNGARDKTKDKEWESEGDESITDKRRAETTREA